MKRKKKVIIVLIAVIVVVTYIAYQLYLSEKVLSTHSLKLEKTAPIEYTELFNEEYIPKIVLSSSVSYSDRNNLTYFSYNSRYDIEVTKINIVSQFNIKSDILENFQEPEGVRPFLYAPYHEDNLDVFYNGDSIESASKIYVSLLGDSAKVVVKNDSLVCYSLKIKKGAVQYKPKGVYEVFFETQFKLSNFSKEKQVNLIFMRKNDSLYYLFLCPLDDSEKLDPLLLYGLIRKNS